MADDARQSDIGFAPPVRVNGRIICKRRPKKNPLDGLDKIIKQAARDTLAMCAEEIDDIERHLLDEHGNVDTGALRDSIHHSTPYVRVNRVSVKGYVDAKNPITNTMYAEFIEHGSGLYRDDGSGRTTPWTYYKPHSNKLHTVMKFNANGQDIEVNDQQEFFTTSGAHPHPFIDPAVQDVNKKLSEAFRKEVVAEMKTAGIYQERMNKRKR